MGIAVEREIRGWSGFVDPKITTHPSGGGDITGGLDGRQEKIGAAARAAHKSNLWAAPQGSRSSGCIGRALLFDAFGDSGNTVSEHQKSHAVTVNGVAIARISGLWHAQGYRKAVVGRTSRDRTPTAGVSHHVTVLEQVFTAHATSID